jgi:D-threo-aldose 1-dehydrogenase
MSGLGANAMPQTTLGRTGIRTSRMTVGAWGFANKAMPFANIGSEENLVATIKAALDAGVRCFDSAEVYACDALLGRIFRDLGAPMDEITVVTKFGHTKGFSGDQFRASAEQSLKDLGIEKLPLMMVHDARSADDMAIVMGKGGALEAMRKLQSEGLLQSVGMATGTMTPLRMAVDSNEFDAIQFPRLYTLLVQVAKTSGIMADARAKGIAVMAGAPYAGNVLAYGMTVEKPIYSGFPVQPEVAPAIEKMESRCNVLKASLREAAFAYTVTEPLVDTVVVGVTSPEEVLQNAAFMHSKLTRTELESIAEVGVVDTYFLGGPEFKMPFPADRAPQRPPQPAPAQR